MQKIRKKSMNVTTVKLYELEGELLTKLAEKELRSRAGEVNFLIMQRAIELGLVKERKEEEEILVHRHK